MNQSYQSPASLNRHCRNSATRRNYSGNINLLRRFSQCASWNRGQSINSGILLRNFKDHEFRINCIAIPKFKRISRIEPACIIRRDMGFTLTPNGVLGTLGIFNSPSAKKARSPKHGRLLIFTGVP